MPNNTYICDTLYKNVICLWVQRLIFSDMRSLVHRVRSKHIIRVDRLFWHAIMFLFVWIGYVVLNTVS